MPTPTLRGRAGALAALAAAALTSCLAAPPEAEAPARLGVVRAATRARASEVAALVDGLAPRVEAAVPEAHLRELEVWVQERPTLYVFQSSAYSDADGFWAEGVRRIHLRERADQPERTLAHELVHAALGETWHALPGTLEEGLCDLVAANLCPDAAPRLRAGRLASAALALGDLALDIELELEADARPDGVATCSIARVRLFADPPVEVDPEDVFVVQAGLSSTSTQPGAKKAFYGLGFLVVERIEERIGLEGLHALCAEARAQGLASVPVERLRAAAGLAGGRAAWSQALADAFGPAEVREVLRLHPDLVARCVGQLLDPLLEDARSLELALASLSHVRGRVRVAGSSHGTVELSDLAVLRPRLEGEMRRRSALAQAR